MNTIVFSLGILELTSSSSISTKIAFGSCNFPGIGAPIFKQIAARNPDLFIWNGDSTYLDYSTSDPRSCWDAFSSTMWRDAQSAALSEWPSLYNTTKYDPNYQLLLDTNCSITGSYDDHDFAQNDVFGFWPHKDYSQSVFLDFLDVPQNHPKRDQQGLYEHLNFEVQMNQNTTKIIDVVVLDLRYFAQVETEEDILGATQWSWLYNVVQNETHGELLLIVSSLQILPVGRLKWTTWGNTFAESQRELFELLLKYNTNKRVLFLTGDIHIAQTLQVQCINQNNGRIQNLHEVTSSGLSHSVGDDSYLIREAVRITGSSMRDGSIMSQYTGRNFGEVAIEWGWNADVNDFEIVSVESKVFDIIGKTQLVLDLPLWDDNAPLDYDVDDSMFIVQTFGDYKCYGGKRQYSVVQNEIFSKFNCSWFILFGQIIALAVFYLTEFVLAIIKRVNPSSKCVNWMYRAPDEPVSASDEPVASDSPDSDEPVTSNEPA
eukprot:625486_1